MGNLMLNRVELCGRLSADPELKSTPTGIPCTTVNLAVGRPYKNQDGKRDADFFRIDLYKHHAEYVCRYLKKGESLYIEGELRVRSFLHPEHGDRRWVQEIYVKEVKSVDSKKKENNSSFDTDEFFDAAVRRSYGEDMKGEEDEQ